MGPYGFCNVWSVIFYFKLRFLVKGGSRGEGGGMRNAEYKLLVLDKGEAGMDADFGIDWIGPLHSC